MRKGHVVLASVAMLMGFGTAFTVDAASYRDIGTVAEGVYLLRGDGAFKVAAVDPVTAVVYDPEGNFLLAKALGSGEARTFIVGDGAVAAILGGGAKVSARNDGRMMPLDTVKNVVDLAANEGPIDEQFSVRLPPFLVGVSGKVQGEADNLVVEVRSSKGLIYRFSDDGAESHLENLAAEVLDASIRADRLDGRIVLEVHQPDMGGMDWNEFEAAMARQHQPSREEMEKHRAEAEKHREKHRPPQAEAPPARTPRPGPEAWEPSLDDVAMTPILLRFPAGGQLSLDIQGGGGVDLGLYDASGAQAQYLQRGLSVGEARSGCRDVTCFFAMPMGDGGSYEELAPEVVAWALEPGDYLLYVRLAHADATFAFEGLGEHFEVELQNVDGSVQDSSTDEILGSVLDFWVHSWNPSVQSEVVASLDGVSFYQESATGSFGVMGGALQYEASYDPSLLGPGVVEVLRSGLALPTDGAQYTIVVVPPLSEVVPAGEDEDEN